MTRLAPYLKALVAALVAGLSVIATALHIPDHTLSAYDYVSALIAFLVALGVVFVVPNRTT